ncbi:hypothetical protein FH972_010057 [Carpinus fangiana]|uniref:Histidine-containing phosphotransfer protein n=1 Tax=Carpinus fangiana TaxID=176857 RepID=A0A660KP30_9ROSI|nr:hypothetical protein FH972_010057 [Carpinus fangiana]
MSLAIHQGMLRGFIQSMHDEGIINDQFWQLQARRPVNQPDYVVRTITSYCVSAQTLFSQLTGLVDQESVNFHQINVSARELIGAEHIKLSCGELLRASAEHDKDQPLSTLVLSMICKECGYILWNGDFIVYALVYAY